MQWVKANERLPKKNEDVYIRFLDKKKGIKDSGHWDGETFWCHHHDYLNSFEGEELSQVEWLDENAYSEIEQLKAENEKLGKQLNKESNARFSMLEKEGKLQSQIKGLVEGLERIRGINEFIYKDVFAFSKKTEEIASETLTNYYNSIK